MNLVKVLSLRFQHYFGPFSMLFIKRSSESGSFRQLSNNVLWRLYFRKYISYEGDLFFENVPNLIYIWKMQRTFAENFFSYWDNFIWIGCVNLSLLRRENFSSAVNALRSSLKILVIIKRGILCLNCFHRDQ